INIRVTPESNFDIELVDGTATTIASSANTGTTAETIQYTVPSTGRYFLHIYTADDAAAGHYTVDVTLQGQNDAGSGRDAGNTMASAMSISPGAYEGYLDVNDWEDWYSFSASSGQGIRISLKVLGEKSDFDVHLYNPSGELVHRAMYYGDDTLEYPADATGTWKFKIDIWPGWDESKWPDNYFLYGSGPYSFELQVGVSVQNPPGPIPQPDITPIAQTFIVEDDPDSSTDEFGYLAAVPAANYIEGGKRYVSPIVYQGVDELTHWFGTVDDTTQYLLDDWNDYLSRHGMTAEEYHIGSDPVAVAADIATTKWTTSNTAVLAVDGSTFEDTYNTVIDQDATLNVQTDVTRVPAGSDKLKDVGGKAALPMFIGPKWAVMTLRAGPISPALGIITPRYEVGTEEDWPHPYDGPGDNTNIYFPISIPGMWFPYAASSSGDWTLEVTKYSGDRYKIPVDTTDCSIEVSVTTEQPSYLEVFLVDPKGNIRRPDVPHWGDPTYENIEPIHYWNGDHHRGFEDWRYWEPEYTTEHTVSLEYPMTGKWTVIVAPHYPFKEEKSSDSIPYHITANIREHNPDRINAQMSAANAAVIASLNHAPLLYVTQDEVPAATSEALSTLGASNLIFVNLDGVSSASVSATEEYTTMQEVINAIKESQHSENYITVISAGTLNGDFAPSGMIAAYHGSPVLNFGEIPEAYSLNDIAYVYQTYAGGWYHGIRAQGYAHKMSKPFDWVEFLQDALQGNIPDPGFDQHNRWYGGAVDIIREWVDSYGLDLEGKEAYMFVGDRETDIRHTICRIMTGNNSFTGMMMFDTPAMQTAHISRTVLYPAIIYANPGRDVTTSQLMNFPDGRTWTTNDGKSTAVRSSQKIKESYSSHGRFFEGHCIWDGYLKRYNDGVSVGYYSGHGTGGSGISYQYHIISEQFPYVEPRYEHLKDFEWWDAWRGYMYDDAQTKDPRWGGFTWYNAAEPNLYDLVHFKWVDQAFENLHSSIELWMSCTTGSHFGPNIYLEHGAIFWYGNAATGLCPQADLLDDAWMEDMMVHGKSIGDAFSDYMWLHQRDYTTRDPTAMYGSSSMTVTNMQVFFGDPTLVAYSPDWTEPTPITP
ncbi:MAG: PPC domain-containing protein, partial [Thermoplasmatota archaeon]